MKVVQRNVDYHDELYQKKFRKITKLVVDQLVDCAKTISTSEQSAANSRLFIDCFVKGALKFLDNDDCRFTCAPFRIGSQARGKFDYDILYHEFHVVLLHVKPPMSLMEGLPQLIGECVASREQTAIIYKAKEKTSDASSVEHALKQVPSFGVLTNGTQWVMVQYFYDEETEKMRVVHGSLFEVSFAVATRRQISAASELVLHQLISMLEVQIQNVKKFEANMKK